MDGRYWFVEYYERPSLIHGLGCDHNAIVSASASSQAKQQRRSTPKHRSTTHERHHNLRNNHRH
jgi:hypothetical protein